MNKRYTFKNNEKTNGKYLWKFYMVFGLNFGTNIYINYMVYEYTGHKMAAFVSATLCGMCVNYIGQKFFVFVKGKK